MNRKIQQFVFENKKKVIPVIALLLLALPFIVTNSYYLHICIMVCVYICLALSLNLVTGYAGQLVLGHAAFYGIGAYTGALLMLKFHVNFLVALLMSAVVTGLFGFLLGIPALRLRGDYLAIVTLGFGEIVRLIFVNWKSLTRGPAGLPGIPAPHLFGVTISGRTEFYYLALALAIFTTFFMIKLINSGVGMAMQTVKNDEIAAEAIGIQPRKYKIMAFVVASAFAGMVGCFFASYLSYISPTAFVYNTSMTILTMVVLGGLGSIMGSVLGAGMLVIVPEVLRFLNDYRMLIFGALMVFMMIFKPEGFWGASKRRRNIYKINSEVPDHGTNS
ncbi:MAG: branched-chain amino acid ABC transporter permease [Acidaminococcaceae bacterium]